MQAWRAFSEQHDGRKKLRRVASVGLQGYAPLMPKLGILSVKGICQEKAGRSARP